MRTKNSLKNMSIVLIGQFIKVLLNFIVRLIFVRVLTTEYLGLEGLFSNILTVLSLAELGIGQAITFSLYDPLKSNDVPKIQALMNLYKKAYISIGLFILIVGLSLNPFLGYFIKETPNINENLHVIYSLYVLTIALSYFASYKRELINADQKMYISNMYIFGCLVVMNILQIIGLIITKQYIVFLVIKIIVVLAENILISKKADKLYPYICEKNNERISKNDMNKIKKNILGAVAYKLGKVGVNATDNIIISKFIGLVSVGLYSNYRLISTSTSTILNQLCSSVTASVGNLGTKNKDKVYSVFNKIYLGGFWLYALVSVGLLVLLNDFVELWLGKDFLLSQSIVLLIVLNFFLNGISSIIAIFRDAFGLYWKGKAKPIVELVVNLVFSLILVGKFGLFGVLIGTLISNVFVNLWWEVKILYNDVFLQSLIEYFKMFLKNFGLMLLSVFLIYGILIIVPINNIYILFIVKGLLVMIITNLVFYITYRNSDEINFYKNVIKNFKKRKKFKKVCL